MKGQKQSKDQTKGQSGKHTKKPSKDKKSVLSRRTTTILIAIAAVLILGSGLGVTHVTIASRYKDYTEPAPTWCAVCHKEPTSHNEQWAATNHGTAALFNKDYCMNCHEDKYCKDCHKKKPVSHDSNWRANHIARAQQDGRGCYECHTAAYCQKCHQAAK
ncbi:MAG TPA: hypothetical protein VGK02_01990 [Candidatus Aquicultor sp.]|jgi:hypothetical protein